MSSSLFRTSSSFCRRFDSMPFCLVATFVTEVSPDSFLWRFLLINRYAFASEHSANKMTWIECKSHMSVFFDSDVYADCPACRNNKLEKALKLSFRLEAKGNNLTLKLLEWFGLGLKSLHSETSKGENIDARVQAASSELMELLRNYTAEHKEFWGYVDENDIRKLP